MDNQFRSSAFGGFNRQDVMEYLERSAVEHRQALEEQRALLDEARKEREELRARLEQAQDQVQKLTRERDDCRREMEQESAGRQNAQALTATQADRLTALEQENALLSDRIAKLEPDAAAYAAIKERTAGMELDAHRRAQVIVDEAQAQAGQIRGQMEQWLGRMRKEYGDLCAQVDATVSHAANELERARRGLDIISQYMGAQHSALDGLGRSYEQAPGSVNE